MSDLDRAGVLRSSRTRRFGAPWERSHSAPWERSHGTPVRRRGAIAPGTTRKEPASMPSTIARMLRRGLQRRISIAILGAVLAIFAAPRAASAASLQEVTNFGRNPTNLRMFLYVPDTVK